MVLFDVGGFESGIQDDTKIDSKEEEKRIYCCIRCGSMITSVSSEITMSGAFKHNFTNPHGFMFTIGCFSQAPGCAEAGPRTSEFSWFPAYSWRISVCATCGLHMGWEFSKEASNFFGLILTNLAEGNDST